MNPILRRGSLLRVVNPSTPSLYCSRKVSPLSWRAYAHSSYGGEGETKAQQPNNPRNTPTRDIEHPGPSAPDVSKGSTASSNSQPRSSTSQEDRDKEDSEGRPIRMSPSNNAKPTITDGRHSPNIDSEGNVKSDVPNDVKKHNEEMEHRYDRPYNQLGNEGKPSKGF
ncbi:conserved serine-rich protein [Aspergillus nomiae NRRL 13137]|uniref:Conserved serine-rich protein n=1 Tax=Aspergillus nomiae NRRL (strain ATCC 15546 / NRRL 13137 / CBS 260.88 / M93) TaxID=1509407 RepID=A0A0L1J0S3_ASPN3|nr:conserved serine-rich protein [Aspergillus nomiae NRRL 13137]KNG84998.1 conserved serine-rich protein [Aspergillus nomiae NRRL 13137]